MLDTIKSIQKAVNDFFEQQKYNIYCAAGLILLIDVLIAVPFTGEFLRTGLVRNFIVFGSPTHAGSLWQFAKYGAQWLAFVDMFILLPCIIWSMLMPSLVSMVRKMQSEEEQ